MAGTASANDGARGGEIVLGRRVVTWVVGLGLTAAALGGAPAPQLRTLDADWARVARRKA